MRDEVIRIVEAYIEGIRKNDMNAVPLHSDVVFESPIRSIKGLPTFEKELRTSFPS
jgi:hypothetical protein